METTTFKSIMACGATSNNGDIIALIIGTPYDMTPKGRAYIGVKCICNSSRANKGLTCAMSEDGRMVISMHPCLLISSFGVGLQVATKSCPKKLWFTRGVDACFRLCLVIN